jgi:Ca2+/Na+ antiporter
MIGDPAWFFVLLGVPLIGGAFLLIAAIAALQAVIQGTTRAPRARSVALRALVLALVSPVLPMIPISLRHDIDMDVFDVAVVMWIAFAVFGCWWLTRPAGWSRDRFKHSGQGAGR